MRVLVAEPWTTIDKEALFRMNSNVPNPTSILVHIHGSERPLVCIGTYSGQHDQAQSKQR